MGVLASKEFFAHHHRQKQRRPRSLSDEEQVKRVGGRSRAEKRKAHCSGLTAAGFLLVLYTSVLTTFFSVRVGRPPKSGEANP